MNFSFRFLFLVIALFSVRLSAQKTILPVTSQEVIDVFSSGGREFLWAFPIGDNQQIVLRWNEKLSSFSSEGIRTFVGYQDAEFKATASIIATDFSAVLFFKSREIHLSTNPDKRLVLEIVENHGHCGSCQNGSCAAEVPVSVQFNSGISQPAFPVREFTTEQNKGFADNVLRIYRLAMPVTYEYFSTKFNSKLTDVRSFWAQTEMALNEIYMRDISVKFQVVNNDNLIIQTATDPINDVSYKRSASTIINNSTSNINKLIGESAYDVGIVIGKNEQLVEGIYGTSGLLGLAGVGAVYTSYAKAQGIAIPELQTIAHEIGHLFGGEHTFSEDGEDSVKTEVGNGQSVMSYGEPMSFFSLVSIAQHIKPILSRIPYYSESNRQNMVGVPFYVDRYYYDNAPYGIKTTNRQPILNKSLIKNEYTIPQGTFFQFNLSASDPDGDALSYIAHPADIKSLAGRETNAQFLTFPASESSTISFQTQYDEDYTNIYRYNTESFVETPYSTPSKTGIYTFWLGVRDSDISNEYTTRQNHASLYDLTETKVKIVSGTPFKFINTFAKSYKANDKITLQWSNDTNIFPATTKVRILLSDDFGKTYKYVLKSSVDNNGKCEVTLPNISIGTFDFKTDFSSNPIPIPAGIIKIEVIDQLAYDVSATRPFSFVNTGSRLQGTILGGFTLEPSAIEFQNTPEQEIRVACQDIPQKADVTAITHSCASSQVDLQYVEENRLSDCVAHTFTRTWIATDTCGNTASFVQTIHVIPVLQFGENLPEDMRVPCNRIPEPPQNLTTIGGCPEVQITYSETRENVTCDKLSYIIRTWTATDSCNNKIQHRQILTIEPEVVIYNAVSTESGSQNYLKVANVSVGRMVIFDQMGLKIYESNNYGDSGDVFRGYSNVKSFNNQKVIAGTYFYIFIYQDANGVTQQKKGYLFVR